MNPSSSKSERSCNCNANIDTHTDTHAKSSSDPSPLPALMSLSDWLSFAWSCSTARLFFPKRRVLRDFSLDFLRPIRR